MKSLPKNKYLLLLFFGILTISAWIIFHNLNNQNAPAHYNLGLLCQQQKQVTKAENVFLEGLKNNPDNERLLYATAHFYLQVGKNRQARQFAQKLVSRFPNRPEYVELLRMTDKNEQ